MSVAAKPVLNGKVEIRIAENGFIVTYISKEYVFVTIAALNTWLSTTSVKG